jgi:hypothetical protein
MIGMAPLATLIGSLGAVMIGMAPPGTLVGSLGR